MSEPKFSTSFIPKKSLQDSIASQPSSKDRFTARSEVQGPIYALTLVAFIIALAVSLGLFAYIRTVDASVKQKLADVQKVRAELKGEVITSLTRLNDRIAVASKLLKEHDALSYILPFLEQTTLKNGILYSSVSYQKGQAGSQNTTSSVPTIDLSGSATSLELVALQMQAYQANPQIVSAVLNDVSRDAEKKTVTFSVSLTIKPDTLIFKQDVAGIGSIVGTSTQASSSAVFVSTSTEATSTAPTSAITTKTTATTSFSTTTH